jgi:CrcB protein
MAGGAIGTLARFVVSSAMMTRLSGKFPYGTFAVNVSGCFLIGVLMTLFTQRAMHANWRFALVVGFLGGYTTFSSFEYETFVAARDGHPLLGLLNVTASVVMGYLAVWLGSNLVAGKD